jgi:hypothetical protein
MKTYVMVYVESEIVIILKVHMVKHVKSTKTVGILMPCDMLSSHCLASEDCCDALKKNDFHGCPRLIVQFMLMMMPLHLQAMHLQRQITKTITLWHLASTVWKPSALHVVLSLPGPSLLEQNHPQIS